LVDWSGVQNGNIFRRPQACLTTIFSGFSDAIPASSRGSYPLEAGSVGAVLLGHSLQSVASRVSESTESFTLSMSSNTEMAVEGASRDVGAARDITVTFEPTFGFRDSSNKFTVPLSQMKTLFASQIFGSEVTFNAAANSIVAFGSIFSLSEPTVESFFFELHAMATILSQAVSSPVNPSVLTFTVATIQNLKLSDSQSQSLPFILARFTETLTKTLNVAFHGQALSVAVSLAPETVHHHHLSTRAIPNGTAADLVAYCQSYTCFCNKDTSGFPFDPATGCQTKPCANGVCQCANLPCDCNSGYVQPGASRCASCLPGFTLQGGQCYVDSNYPGMFQIWFWGGIGITLALITTCYTVGGMDPGRNGIVYRMTSQRAKTS